MRHASLIRRSVARPHVGLLTLCAALSALWLGLGMTLLGGVSHLSHQWDQRVFHTTLIVLPHDTKRDVQPLLHELAHLPAVSTDRLLPSEEIDHLLTQWGAPWPSPTPEIIALTGKVDPSTLETLSKRFSEDASVILPPPPSTTWLSFSKTLQTSTAEISAMIILSSGVFFVLSLLLSWRSSRLAQHSGLVLLHQLGCPLHRGYRSSVRRFALASCVGSSVGILSVLPLIYTLTRTFSPLLHEAGPSNFLTFIVSSWGDMTMLYVIPVFYTVLGYSLSWVCYRLTARTLS